MGKFFVYSKQFLKNSNHLFFFVKEMQTISSEHNHGGATGRGSWEYYERKNTSLDDSQPLNNKQDPKEYLT